MVSCLTLEALCSLCVSACTGRGSSSLEASNSVSLNVCHGRRTVAFVSGDVVNYSGGGFSYLMLSWCDTTDHYRKIKMGKTCFSIPHIHPPLVHLCRSFRLAHSNDIDLIMTEMGNGCHQKGLTWLDVWFVCAVTSVSEQSLYCGFSHVGAGKFLWKIKTSLTHSVISSMPSLFL